MQPNALLAFLLAFAALPAGAATLYKSVDADGTMTFSDLPPPPGARTLEERQVGPPYAADESPSPVTPAPAHARREDFYELIDSDVALAQANARVDQAERALALARNGVAPRYEGLRLASTRNSAADNERIEFCRRDLKLARRALVDLIKERQQAEREPGAPRIVASNAYGSLLGAVR